MRLLVAVLRIVLPVALVTFGAVLPFAHAVSNQLGDLQIAAGVAMAIGTLLGWRAPNGPSPLLGAAAAFAIGIAAALIAGLPGNGVLIMLPPLQALACGFLWVARTNPIERVSEVLRMSFGTGLWLGIGLLITPMNVFGLGSALFIAAAFCPIVEVARIAAARRAGREVGLRPLGLMIVVWGLVSAAAYLLVAAESLPLNWWQRSLLILGLILAVPATVFPAAVVMFRWFAHRVRYLRALREYLSALYLPIGAFAIGYVVIIVVFAGMFGSLHRIDAGAFRFADEGMSTTIATWLYFSFFVATSQSVADIAPQSGLAKVLVGTQMVLCLAWAIVVFAAVMAHVQPVLQRVADRDATKEP